MLWTWPNVYSFGDLNLLFITSLLHPLLGLIHIKSPESPSSGSFRCPWWKYLSLLRGGSFSSRISDQDRSPYTHPKSQNPDSSALHGALRPAWLPAAHQALHQSFTLCLFALIWLLLHLVYVCGGVIGHLPLLPLKRPPVPQKYVLSGSICSTAGGSLSSP